MPKFKVGDKVRLRKFHPNETDGNLNFNFQMRACVGTVVTITVSGNAYDTWYRVRENGWTWPECATTRVDHELEVKDGDKWRVVYASGHSEEVSTTESRLRQMYQDLQSVDRDRIFKTTTATFLRLA